MKVGTRIFISTLFIFSACLYYPSNWFVETLRTRYLEGVEDPLVDQANILATFVGHEMQNGSFDPEQWYAAFEEIYQLNPKAKIYSLIKQQVDIRIYITDQKGIIVFDSQKRKNIGLDYSKWRDVYLTLEGKYGARTTKSGVDHSSAVLYVAAPIRVDYAVMGVLTVAKPTTNITYFVHNAKLAFVSVVLIALFAASLLSYLTSWWITLPIGRLTAYAKRIGRNIPADFPKLDSSEIGEMGKAFEQMQETLEGKQYVERYIQHLTHEIKSPLSAIRGAAELLTEPMPKPQRDLFLSNIHSESLRIQQIVDRMLALSALESKKRIMSKENVALQSLFDEVLTSKQSLLIKKELHVDVEVQTGTTVFGDPFLLHQAMSNLVQNSIDFSPEKGTIKLRGKTGIKGTYLEVSDQGPGIPSYAMEKIFDKFFSLNRPDSNRKSTGLGLNFVKQIAKLHQGSIQVISLKEGIGTKSVLWVPGPTAGV